MAVPLLGDENFSRPLANFLRGRGHDLDLTGDLGLHRATDGKVLLTAASLGRVLLTHNERDFALLHDAWLRWTAEWSIAPNHPGIIILPQAQRWEWARSAAEIEELLTDTPGEPAGTRLANRLWAWRASRGWAEFVDLNRWRPGATW